MKKYTYTVSFTALLMLFSLVGRGQDTPGITALPLSYTSVCPGSLITVPFTSTGTGTSKFIVQFLDGKNTIEVSTHVELGFDYWLRVSQIIARVPVEIPINQTYKVRISMVGSPIISSVSPTSITVKNGSKPVVPTCDSIQYGCQFAPPTQPSTITSSLSVRGLTPSSEVFLYDDNGLNTRWTPSRYIDNMGNKSPYASFSAENVNGNPYTKNFYFTQSVNGCESDKASTKLKILPVNGNEIGRAHV